MVENKSVLKVKKLRIDNEGEYEDTRFKKFFYEHKIKMERIVPSTPQHNVVTQCMKTLTKRAKNLLYNQAYRNNFRQKQSIQQLT